MAECTSDKKISEIARISRAAPNRESPEWLIRHIGRAHRQAVDTLLSKNSQLVKPGQPIILMILQDAQRADQVIYQGDLAKVLQVSNPTITASLHSLERQGYILRESDAADMRRKKLYLTELGNEAANLCRKTLQTVDSTMLQDFDPEEREIFAGLIKRVMNNLESITNS